MLLVLSFALPVLTALVLLLFFRDRMVWWEWIAVIAGSMLFTLLVYVVARSCSQSATEYLGGYVTEVKHYDDWNELVTKTREVPCGTDKDGNTKYCTETYTEVEYHPERWVMETSLGRGERGIDKATFDEFRKRFNVPMVFIDMHRHYHTKDGDAQAYRWNGKRETFIPVTETHTYKNPLKNSNSIFRYSGIEKDSARALGLYEYPPIKGYNQTPVIGCYPDVESLDRLNWINATYGAKYQFRLFVLVFPSSKGEEIAEMQKGYWQGGNKNEFVVCLGVDAYNKVKWCNAFSWCDSPWLEVESRSWFNEHDTLDLDAYGKWLEGKIPLKWKRKEFSDFKYVKSNLTNGGKWVVFIMTLVFCIGMAWFVVTNEF